jgi:phosphoethanolamine N-methyltransferase
LKDWLKPGGKIFITDYCCGPKPWSDEFTGYVEQRGYDLRTVDEYGNIFSRLGFRTVKALDVTNLFVESLNNELSKMNQIKDDFLREFSEEDFQYLIDGWKAKLVRCAEGFQKWGLFYCEK